MEQQEKELPECYYCKQSWRDSDNWYKIPEEKRHKVITCRACIRAGGKIDPRIKD